MAICIGPTGGSPRVPHFDHWSLDTIMADINDMAANPKPLERVRNRRFDRDEPPPYGSPPPDLDTEESEFFPRSMVPG